MGKIERNPTAAARESYDLIIIGGGIYGAMLSLEASRRRLRSLLIERDDFGGATSYNHLHIIHGGLRYLQSFDFYRFHESVDERKWFLKNFPYLVHPLPCLMPLYGKGLHRPSILRIAMVFNDLLSSNRNQGISRGKQIPNGSIIKAEAARRIFPDIDIQGLRGGAVWYDALIPDSQRILMEILRKSCAHGTTAINYTEATKLLTTDKGVAGVIALDHETGISYEFKGEIVINAAGPWCRDLSALFDRDVPFLFKHSIAWNILFERKALSEYALAITPKNPGAQTYFLIPWKGALLAGTGHAPYSFHEKKPVPPEETLLKFLDDLNIAIPGLDLSANDILHIYSGYLPVKEEGGTALTKREAIYNHGVNGGPKGLYTVSGIKFTTSRIVAAKMLNMIFHDIEGDMISDDIFFPNTVGRREKSGLFDFEWYPKTDDSSWKKDIARIIDEESVIHLDDLILRRTNLGDNPVRAMKIVPLICDLFKWDSSRTQEEVRRLKTQYNQNKFS